MVTAKFRCASVTDYGESRLVELSALTGKDGDNVDWSKWTPAGKITMSITNPDAFSQFAPGKLYLINFEEVEK